MGSGQNHKMNGDLEIEGRVRNREYRRKTELKGSRRIEGILCLFCLYEKYKSWRAVHFKVFELYL